MRGLSLRSPGAGRGSPTWTSGVGARVGAGRAPRPRITVDSAAFFVAVAFAFALPWERSIPVPGVGSVGRLIGLVAFPMALLALADHGKVRLRRPPWMIVVAGTLTLWSIASVLWSIEPGETVGRAFTYVQLLAMIWVFWQAASTSGRRRALLQAYVVGCYVMIVAVAGTFIATGGAEGVVRYSGFDENQNYLAQRLALGLPLAWYLVLLGGRTVMRWVNAAYLPACMLALALAASRGAFVMAVVALAVVSMTIRYLPVGRAIAIVLILSLGVAGLALIVPEENLTRLAETGDRILAGDLTLREDIWRAGIRAYLDPSVSWLLGSGSGTFPVLVAPEFGSARTSHNGYLSVLIELGVVGAVLLLILIGVTATPLLSLPPMERWMGAAVLSSLMVVMMTASWDFERAWWFGMIVVVMHGSYVVDPNELTLANRTKDHPG